MEAKLRYSKIFSKSRIGAKKTLLFPTRESVFSFAGITLYRMYMARYASFLFLFSFFRPPGNPVGPPKTTKIDKKS